MYVDNDTEKQHQKGRIYKRLYPDTEHPVNEKGGEHPHRKPLKRVPTGAKELVDGHEPSTPFAAAMNSRSASSRSATHATAARTTPSETDPKAPA